MDKKKDNKKDIQKFQSCFWIWNKRHLESGVDYYIIETTNFSVIKDHKLEKCPCWGKWDKHGKLLCIHIRVRKDSPEQKYIFKVLGLKMKDRYIDNKEE